MRTQVFLLALAPVLQTSLGQVFSGPQDPRVHRALTLDTPSTGLSTTPDGRTFLVLSHIDGSHGAQLVEVKNGTTMHSGKSLAPYPNQEWNSYAAGKDPATHFINVNAQRVGPDGYLYAIDTGSAFGGQTTFPSGTKLVQIDIQKNQVSRIYPMGNATFPNSLLDDVRFHESSGKAYLTDALSPGLIVLDLSTGIARRVLNRDISTVASTPISAEGHSLTLSNGLPAYISADQLEVSPNGKWLYFQPASGGMSRIQTKYLDQAFYNSSMENEVLAGFVQPFANTPSTGGTAIDAHGNIYTSDTDEQRIIKVSPSGCKSVLVQDPRLVWIDAMWISGTKLYMPSSQLNRGNIFGNGRSNITKPVHVYTIDIGVGPSPIDHA